MTLSVVDFRDKQQDYTEQESAGNVTRRCNLRTIVEPHMIHDEEREKCELQI
jgi:hypothetical protein